jgi:hypothetical protein
MRGIVQLLSHRLGFGGLLGMTRETGMV